MKVLIISTVFIETNLSLKGKENSMIKAIVSTNSLALPTTSEIIRLPPRKPEDQQPGYLHRFDFHLIFADIFRLGKDVIAVGPPYLNLREFLESSSFSFSGGDRVSLANIEFNELNRTSRTLIRLPLVGESVFPADSITLANDSLVIESRIGTDMNDVFCGKNVLMTMSRDNYLENISDWVSVNVRANDINAVIIFNNRSKLYTNKELLNTISEIDGIEVAIVVDWPHAYGLPGGPKQIWDSDFGQYTAWETARWRFVKHAKSVMISDVDEVPLTESGIPCWQAAEMSPSGVYYYPMRDVQAVVPIGADPSRLRRHADYNYYIPGSEGSDKYTYIPSRINDNQQLLVHAVTHAPNPREVEGYVRHFKGLHRAWRDGSYGYTNREATNRSPEMLPDVRLANLFSQDLFFKVRKEVDG